MKRQILFDNWQKHHLGKHNKHMFHCKWSWATYQTICSLDKQTEDGASRATHWLCSGRVNLHICLERKQFAADQKWTSLMWNVALSFVFVLSRCQTCRGENSWVAKYRDVCVCSPQVCQKWGQVCLHRDVGTQRTVITLQVMWIKWQKYPGVLKRQCLKLLRTQCRFKPSHTVTRTQQTFRQTV